MDLAWVIPFVLLLILAFFYAVHLYFLKRKITYLEGQLDILKQLARKYMHVQSQNFGVEAVNGKDAADLLSC